MTIYGGPEIATDGLVLYLDAGNSKSYPGSGTAWNDLSGNNYHGTLTNGPTFSSDNKGGIVFDGTNDYCVGGNTSSVNGNHTLSVIFKNIGQSSTNDAAGAIMFAQSNSINFGIMMQFSYQNQYLAFASKVNSSLGSSVGSVLNNMINHAVGVYDGSTQKIYLNGQLLASRNYTEAPVLSSPALQIGRWGYSGFERYFNGLIYNVALYNRSLTAMEVLQNYNALKGRFGL